MIDDMQDEIRKLKAMIVKHEKRIRVLEAKSAVDGDGEHASLPPAAAAVSAAASPASLDPPPQITVTPNNTHAPEELAPDEV